MNGAEPLRAASAKPTEPGPAEHSNVRGLIMGFRTTQLIYVAAKLDLARHLYDRAQTAKELASCTGAHPRSLYRILRALASLGLFTETTTGEFSLSPAGRCLLPSGTGSLRDMALLYGAPWYWKAYGAMLHSIMTGEPAFQHVHGAALYDYFETHWQEAGIFHAAMRGFSAMETSAILAAYAFQGEAHFVDVGGGEGALLAALLQRYPRATGIVLDLDSAAYEAKRLFARHGLKDRADFVAGDFFQAVPRDGDVYILKSIIHNWTDGRALAILRNCRAAMPPGARLLVIERVIPLGNGPSEAKLFDINMLVAIGGQERSEAEYRELLQRAGFSPERMIATASPLSLIEAVPDAASAARLVHGF